MKARHLRIRATRAGVDPHDPHQDHGDNLTGDE